MSIRHLSEDVAVCGQITPQDLEQIASLGFKTIVNNRPDNEEPGQPSHSDIEAKAKSLGLTVYYMPLGMGQPPSMELLRAFRDVVDQSDKPVLAYCRSGNRSGQIYAGACGLS